MSKKLGWVRTGNKGEGKEKKHEIYLYRINEHQKKVSYEFFTIISMATLGDQAVSSFFTDPIRRSACASR